MYENPPRVNGTLRKFMLHVPEVIDKCSGIEVFGTLIKSIVFSTDISIIRNVNADAVIAVYPFTPQPIITQSVMLASDKPVFTGFSEDGREIYGADIYIEAAERGELP